LNIIQGKHYAIVPQARWRRRYVLTVIKDGTVEIRIPASWKEQKISEVMFRHRRWLAKRAEELEARREKEANKISIDWCELPDTWWRKAARVDLWNRLDIWADEMSLTIRKRRLTGARTRWGSCNSMGDISLSWRLMLTAPELRDYVVIHELAHRRHMNHSPRFWAEVARWCPDYKERRTRLRTSGGEIG